MKSIAIPLAERMRPSNLIEIIGQDHLVGNSGIFKSFIEKNTLPSIILWGAPGIGKTSIASLISKEFNLPMHSLSAISSGVKEVRQVIEDAKQNGVTLLFIDEIHRFSKSQQDALLAAVENGWIKLIGATTENPSFEVIRPLLSRCQVYTLNPLSDEHLLQLIERAIQKDDIIKQFQINLRETDALFQLSGGDARRLLNIFELAICCAENNKVDITDNLIMSVVQNKIALYDKDGEEHYNFISAYIKSIRGSDPNAALYYLMKMIDGGEDPKFIARRLIILASEDIGMSNSNALLIANACFNAVETIGLPECTLNLAHTTIYLSTSVKSNSVYTAVKSAKQIINNNSMLPVPLPLRNPVTSLMQNLEYGKGYIYSHPFVEQEYLPTEIAGTKLYEPSNNSREEEVRNFLKKCWQSKYNY